MFENQLGAVPVVHSTFYSKSENVTDLLMSYSYTIQQDNFNQTLLNPLSEIFIKINRKKNHYFLIIISFDYIYITRKKERKKESKKIRNGIWNKINDSKR